MLIPQSRSLGTQYQCHAAGVDCWCCLCFFKKYQPAGSRRIRLLRIGICKSGQSKKFLRTQSSTEQTNVHEKLSVALNFRISELNELNKSPNQLPLKKKKPVGTWSDRINTKNKHYLTNTIVILRKLQCFIAPLMIQRYSGLQAPTITAADKSGIAIIGLLLKFGH